MLKKVRQTDRELSDDELKGIIELAKSSTILQRLELYFKYKEQLYQILSSISSSDDLKIESARISLCFECLQSFIGPLGDKSSFSKNGINSSLKRIFERGEWDILDESLVLCVIETCKHLSSNPFTRDALLDLIQPHIVPWLDRYTSSQCIREWLLVLCNITLLEGDFKPCPHRCESLFSIFYPILSMIKSHFRNEKIIEVIHFLLLLSHFCCFSEDRSKKCYMHVYELLPEWIAEIKKSECSTGVVYWSKLLAMFSCVPSLLEQLSPKYDKDMQWSSDNGGIERYVSSFFENIRSQASQISSFEIDGIILQCIQCSSSSALSRQFHMYCLSLQGIFSHAVSIDDIRLDSTRLLLACRCLYHLMGDFETPLPLDDMDELYSTFIRDLIRIEKVLGDCISEWLFGICSRYAYMKDDEKRKEIYVTIEDSLSSIMDKGEHETVSDSLASKVVSTCLNISLCLDSIVLDPMVKLIKTKVIPWVYKYSHIFEDIIKLLNHLTICDSEQDKTHLKISHCSDIDHPAVVPSSKNSGFLTRCSDIFPLFKHLSAIIRARLRSRKGRNLENITYIIGLCANLCCNPTFVEPIHDQIEMFLEEWFDAFRSQWEEDSKKLDDERVPRQPFDLTQSDCQSGMASVENDLTNSIFSPPKHWTSEFSSPIMFHGSSLKKEDLMTPLVSNYDKLDVSVSTMSIHTQVQKGMFCWAKLVALLTSIPSLCEKLSPKYDSQMSWWVDNVDFIDGDGSGINWFQMFIDNVQEEERTQRVKKSLKFDVEQMISGILEKEQEKLREKERKMEETIEMEVQRRMKEIQETLEEEEEQKIEIGEKRKQKKDLSSHSSSCNCM
ncbi:hypothetical protein ADUPG1_000337 [Aduncisulcus paluster]|uniref:Uncharacterized protein n=1 Tax=Aduncisulcus paluster TaxID=2918883 RepID=A0ABQ5K7Q3_9EUKA|nr:hypothetical protein ADUPG1_000337 [Aduncisulcus paluster]